MQFFLAIDPPRTTHQMKKVRVVKGKPQFYEPTKLAEARRDLYEALHPHKPAEPIDGAIRLVAKWCWNGKADGQYKTTKPDVDNSTKLLLDVMTKLGYWHDDAQVASLIVEKFWSRQPGIFISIEGLSQ
ncbi:hypothetical protein PDESU_03329 [Pontiella desulfatans]|uniref:Uncharacterized protein n=1 Tax=Pontiella desulfatans TaxID=2750659 RepID=A0A6C2U465_PONDE|nr:RusA family crossover junction endodeoxyribonuclease [Pontiella desulfatans]VGO14760.1 hypothetical protein PDESU_03329 [Pontiella desulfatans]